MPKIDGNYLDCIDRIRYYIKMLPDPQCGLFYHVRLQLHWKHYSEDGESKRWTKITKLKPFEGSVPNCGGHYTIWSNSFRYTGKHHPYNYRSYNRCWFP